MIDSRPRGCEQLETTYKLSPCSKHPGVLIFKQDLLRKGEKEHFFKLPK